MFKKESLFLVFILLFVLVLSACGNSNADSTVDKNIQKVHVVAHNFEFNKPEYTVKAGEAVQITLKSKDGVHGLTIDEFHVNISAPGGTATFTPDKPGKYKIYCNTFCGEGHDGMTAFLVVK